jgi:hypothetical protein
MFTSTSENTAQSLFMFMVTPLPYFVFPQLRVTLWNLGTRAVYNRVGVTASTESRYGISNRIDMLARDGDAAEAKRRHCFANDFGRYKEWHNATNTNTPKKCAPFAVLPRRGT